MTTMNDVQVNARLPRPLKTKLKTEAARTGKTIEIVLEAALSDFFKSWTAEERLRFYTARPYARKS